MLDVCNIAINEGYLIWRHDDFVYLQDLKKGKLIQIQSIGKHIKIYKGLESILRN
jgi:hypothetical protein